MIQDALLSLKLKPGTIDGRLSPNTSGAIKVFQRTYGLIIDGIAGP